MYEVSIQAKIDYKNNPDTQKENLNPSEEGTPNHSETQNKPVKSRNKDALMLFLLAPISSKDMIEKKGTTIALMKILLAAGLQAGAVLLALYAFLKGGAGLLSVLQSILNNEPWLNIKDGLLHIFYGGVYWGIAGLMRISGQDIEKMDKNEEVFGVYTAILSIISIVVTYIVSKK